MHSGNHFQFSQNQALPGVRVLEASMADFSYDKHAHEEFGLGLTLAGEQHFASQGTFFRSRPGHIIQFNPDQDHDGHAGTQAPLYYHMLYINEDYLQSLAQALGAPSGQSVYARQTLIQHSQMHRNLRQLCQMLQQGIGSGMALEQKLIEVASLFIRLNTDQAPIQSGISQTSRHDAMIERAREFIRDNLRQNLTLEEISDQVHLSKFHFLRLFKQHTGMTPHQYLFSCRLGAARHAVEHGEGLTAIAHSFGFADLSHFNRRFKKVYGMTPAQYQKHLYLNTG
ncbi:hypothetical protein BFW38_05595 [Terasakiispira papahanaumokuakeensis]|uniref:HTH araC/xylS-type domain-containing protein n=1 Tax=Terasakiispira papahanaumokuakeensis TaxID=197479 RepID=A0A1E2V7V6_9GAMM|nr:AraC family transcriptional regulator [Terasakiispira papahanaumokuakeensis]ODC03098.1 hypothetical protein BFW38_05595 [Terasakiispira papahanaumokuakeensis]